MAKANGELTDRAVERPGSLGYRGLSLFHQEGLILLATGRTEDHFPEEPPHGQHKDNQQQQLQAPENGVCLARLGPGLPRPLGFGLSLGLQLMHRGCGVELGHEFLLHETSVNRWLEDLQLLATAVQVHDGAAVLAGSELVVPSQSGVVGLPVDGPGREEQRVTRQGPGESWD